MGRFSMLRWLWGCYSKSDASVGQLGTTSVPNVENYPTEALAWGGGGEHGRNFPCEDWVLLVLQDRQLVLQGLDALPVAMGMALGNAGHAGSHNS